MRFGLDTASDAVMYIATEIIKQPLNRASCWSATADGGVRIEDRAGRTYDFDHAAIEEAALTAKEAIRRFK